MNYFMNFVAVLFAFLVAAYFVGSRMSRPMLAVVIALYTVFCTAELMAVHVCMQWWGEIATELAHRGVDQTGRVRYPIEMFSGSKGDMLRYFTLFIYIASYIGGLYFLREARLLRSESAA